MTGPPASRGGSNGIWGGELGDGSEGSLRTPAMIRWPGRIKPARSNGMVSIHDILIYADHQEKFNIAADNAWVLGPYMKIIAEYKKTLEKDPNPPAISLTEFD